MCILVLSCILYFYTNPQSEGHNDDKVRDDDADIDARNVANIGRHDVRLWCNNDEPMNVALTVLSVCEPLSFNKQRTDDDGAS